VKYGVRYGVPIVKMAGATKCDARIVYNVVNFRLSWIQAEQPTHMCVWVMNYRTCACVCW
jgi:hypothetical protein